MTTQKERKNNKNNTTRKGGLVIDSGGFGCIFKPALQCSSTRKRGKKERNQITKLMKSTYAKREYTEILKYKTLLKTIPHYKNYFLIDDITICNPSALTQDDLRNFKTNCKPLEKTGIDQDNINTKESLDQLLALTMPYGGIDINKYLKTKRDRQELNAKLIDLLQNGILPMNAKHVYHCDLKSSNVLVKKTQKSVFCRIIDWGLSVIYKPNNPIPTVLRNRSIQFNVPFSSILFTDMFDEMYSKYLNSGAANNNARKTKTFVKSYRQAWFKGGPGNSKTIQSIFNYVFDEKSDDFIDEYLTRILIHYTKGGVFESAKYFNDVYIKNIDIWGFTMIYISFLAYFIEKDMLTSVAPIFKRIFTFLLSHDTTVIPIDALVSLLIIP